MSNEIIFSQENHIAIIAFNRPESYNALTPSMLKQLAEVILKVASDKKTRAVVLAGQGKAFCSGADLIKTAKYASEMDDAVYELASYANTAALELARMRKPTIAAVNGAAAGAGFSLALACDFRVMAHSASLKQAFTSAGLSMDTGMSFQLPRIVGKARALEIATFDPTITSAQALDWGLATQVVADDKLLSSALAMAENIIKRSLNSFSWSKRLITDSYDHTLETQLQKERMGISRCAAHRDGREGMKAFAEKRRPQFNQAYET
jgi:2-(1,2-epoxy-1,2-dihydrophenyl)acetyl-CoA isomerase